MTGRSFVVSLVATAVVFALVGRCSAPDPAGLPPKVAAAVERHTIRSVVDTATTHRLERDTARAGRQQRAAAAAQLEAERTAASEKARADSLAGVAALATTAHDSAIAYHAAYEASTDRGNRLEEALTNAGRQLLAAAQRQAQSDSIARIWQAHAVRGDSVIALLKPLTAQGDRCRILWVAKCPTRTQVFVGGAVVGVTATLIATGKVKIPLALRF